MAFVPFVETDQPTMAAFNEKFQQNFEAAVAAGVQIAIGSYVGDGSRTKTLSIPFKAEFLFIYGDYIYVPGPSYGEGFGMSVVDSGAFILQRGSNAPVMTISRTETGVSWIYETTNSTYQTAECSQNASGKTYHYFAIGKKEE